MSSGKKRQLSGDSERVSTQDSSVHDTIKPAGDKTLKAAKRSRRVTISTDTGDTTSDKQDSKGAAVKVKRQAWTATAISAFFEGLCEHGKDFGRILKFMKNKYRKKQDPFISNLMRNQVRFFYYRTWHKVSTLLNIAGKQSRSAPPGDEELPLTFNSNTKQELLSTVDAGTKKELEDEAVEMLSSPPPSHEEPGTQGLQQNLSEEETEGEGEGDMAFDISLDEGEEPSAGERHSLANDEDMVSESNNAANNPSDFCEIQCQKEQSSAHFGLGATVTNTITTSSTVATNTTTTGTAVTTTTTAITATATMTVAMTTSTAAGSGKTDSVGEGGAIAVKGKERHSEGQMMVHGALHSLDLVALICYSKIKMKFTGDKQTLGKKLNELIYTGSTTIRVNCSKGRRKIQLKIPNCPALRGNKVLNTAHVSGAADAHCACSASDSEVAGGVDQRKSLVVELFPLNSHSWAYVQHLSMNPRIRLTVPSSRKVSDVVHIVASKWQLINHDEPASEVLKLYCQSMMSHPHTNMSAQSSSAVSSTGVAQAEDEARVGDLTAGQEQRCRDKSKPASGITQVAVEDKNFQNSVRDPLVVQDGLQPLQPFGMTVGELHEQTNKDKASLKLGLLYEIRNNQLQDSLEENRLCLLLQLAEFIAKDSAKLSSVSFAMPSPCTPSAATTPTSHSSPLVLSSPAVVEYMRTLPKKSPLKSPLSKYRRMQRLRQSPLKTPSPLPRPKPVRLRFDMQPSPHHSPVQDVGMSDTLPIASNISSPLSSCASLPPVVDTLVSTPSTRRLHPLLNRTLHSEAFSIAKHNADHKKSKPQQQKVHLVTVSKKALKNSGSFSRLRLNDLFKTVNENLKDATSSEDRGGMAGEVLSEDPLCPVLPATSDNSAGTPLLNLQKQYKQSRVSPVTALAPDGCSVSPQVSSTLSRVVPSSSLAHHPSTVTATVLPVVSTTGRLLAAVTTSSQATPSPLEKLASKMATSGSLTQWIPPASSAAGSSQIVVRPLTIGSPQSSVVPVCSQQSTSLSSIKALTKPSRRQNKIRAAKNMPPPSQRPVVPKPLLYLPQMAQMKSSLGRHSKSNASVRTHLSVAGSSTVLGSIASASISNNTKTTPSGTAPPGNINQQTVQSQLINLLQNILQQQLSRQHQQQTQPQLVPPSSGTQAMQAQFPAQSIPSTVLTDRTHDLATNLPLSPMAVSTSFLGQLTVSSTIDSSNVTSSHSLSSPFLSGQNMFHSSSDTVNELLRGLTTASSSQDRALKKLSEETSDVLPTFAKAMMQLDAISSSNPQRYLQRGSAVEDDGPQDLEEFPEEEHPLGNSSEVQRDSSGSSDSLLAFLQGEGCEVGNISDANLRQLVEQVDFSDAFSQLKDILKTPERPKDPVHIRSTSGDADLVDNLCSGPPLLDHDNSICSLLDLLSSPLKGRTSVETQYPSSRDIGAAGIPDTAGVTTVHEGTDAGIRHMIEENSVDYITKFRELASAMNRSSSS